MPATNEAAGTVIPVVRFIYRGESLRNGRVCRLAADDLNLAEPIVAGELLLRAMRSADTNLDLARFAPFVYSQELEGWVALRPETEVPMRWAEPAASTAGKPRVLRAEVMLEVKQPAAPARERDLSVAAALTSAASVAVATVGGAASAGEAEGAAEGAAEATASAEGTASADAAEGEGASGVGFFAVGVYNSKSADNVGTLWRSAFQLGAAYIFTIGARNAWEKTADTYRSWRRIPAFRFADWGGFCAASPYSTVWVAVEMGGVPLADFEHPERYRQLALTRTRTRTRTLTRTIHACQLRRDLSIYPSQVRLRAGCGGPGPAARRGARLHALCLARVLA